MQKTTECRILWNHVIKILGDKRSHPGEQATAIGTPGLETRTDKARPIAFKKSLGVAKVNTPKLIGPPELPLVIIPLASV